MCVGIWIYNAANHRRQKTERSGAFRRPSAIALLAQKALVKLLNNYIFHCSTRTLKCFSYGVTHSERKGWFPCWITREIS